MAAYGLGGAGFDFYPTVLSAIAALENGSNALLLTGRAGRWSALVPSGITQDGGRASIEPSPGRLDALLERDVVAPVRTVGAG